MPRLDDTAVVEGLARLPSWERRHQLAKTFVREDFAHAMAFVNEVAAAAEARPGRATLPRPGLPQTAMASLNGLTASVRGERRARVRAGTRPVAQTGSRRHPPRPGSRARPH
jgi:hypothetical protein